MASCWPLQLYRYGDWCSALAARVCFCVNGCAHTHTHTYVSECAWPPLSPRLFYGTFTGSWRGTERSLPTLSDSFCLVSLHYIQRSSFSQAPFVCNVNDVIHITGKSCNTQHALIFLLTIQSWLDIFVKSLCTYLVFQIKFCVIYVTEDELLFNLCNEWARSFSVLLSAWVWYWFIKTKKLST